MDDEIKKSITFEVAIGSPKNWQDLSILAWQRYRVCQIECDQLQTALRESEEKIVDSRIPDIDIERYFHNEDLLDKKRELMGTWERIHLGAKAAHKKEMSLRKKPEEQAKIKLDLCDEAGLSDPRKIDKTIRIIIQHVLPVGQLLKSFADGAAILTETQRFSGLFGYIFSRRSLREDTNVRRITRSQHDGEAHALETLFSSSSELYAGLVKEGQKNPLLPRNTSLIAIVRQYNKGLTKRAERAIRSILQPPKLVRGRAP